MHRNVCVCMWCVCVYVCAYVYVCVCVCVCVYVCVRACCVFVHMCGVSAQVQCKNWTTSCVVRTDFTDYTYIILAKLGHSNILHGVHQIQGVMRVCMYVCARRLKFDSYLLYSRFKGSHCHPVLRK